MLWGQSEDRGYFVEREAALFYRGLCRDILTCNKCFHWYPSRSATTRCTCQSTPHPVGASRSLLTSSRLGTGKRNTLKSFTSAKCCIRLCAMSGEGQPYWHSNSLGEKLPCPLLLCMLGKFECLRTYECVDADLAACNINATQADGVGVRCDRRYHE